MFTADMMRYSLAKLANFIFAQQLQRVLDEQGSSIISLSVHPGSVRSVNALDIFSGPLKPVMRRVMLTEDEGSFTLLFAATAKEVRERPDAFKGKYLEPIGEVKPGHVVANDEEQVRGLWDNTSKEVNKFLAKEGFAPLLDW